MNTRQHATPIDPERVAIKTLLNMLYGKVISYVEDTYTAELRRIAKMVAYAIVLLALGVVVSVVGWVALVIFLVVNGAG